MSTSIDHETLPSKASILLVCVHPDDEYGTGGGIISLYNFVRKKPVILVCLTEGEAGGNATVRKKELEMACWTAGMKHPPIIGSFADYGYPPRPDDLENCWRKWGSKEKAVAYVTRIVRQYKPDVIVTHDPWNGEYGHANHIAAGQAAVAAYDAAPDQDRFPEQVAEFGTWQTQKLYVHLSETSSWKRYIESAKFTFIPDLTEQENRIKDSWYHTWKMPMPGTDKTVREMASEGLRCHVSQNMAKHTIAEKTLFLLLDSKVGPDMKRTDDLLEHVG